MTWLPITAELEVLRRSDGELDSHRNPIRTWVAEPWPVYQWGPASSAEPFTVGPNRLEVERVVHAPTAPPSTARVRFPDGAVFEVAGEPEDLNHGFHGWEPGFQVNLVRVDG